MGSGDVTGSILPQWHQCCLPTSFPQKSLQEPRSGAELCLVLGQSWNSTSPVQHFCHPIPNSWSRNSASTPVCEPWGMVAACSFLVGDKWLWKCALLALVCTLGQGGAVKQWDLPLLGRAGREMQIMSSPCAGEVQKAVGIPGLPMSPGQRVSASIAQGASRSCLA